MSTLLASPSPSSSSLNLLAAGARVVRFDNQCVLIPDTRTKRPKMVTKSYSLPLWRKRPSDTAPELLDDAGDGHLTFKVPVPSFMTKARSPSRGRGAGPLSSCLVNSDTTPSVPLHPRRRPSVSLPPRHKGPTVPLRACCTDCVHATEECLREGPRWQEKFSRGAHRRRSASLDTGSALPLPSTAGFAAVVSSSFPELFCLTVDEVDRRRRSHDYTPNAQDDHSPQSSSSSSDPAQDTQALPHRKSPIPEEDEDQLFPLPSPRRTPNPSPNASPRASPTPTPNTSTSSLGMGRYICKTARTASRDSLPVSDEPPARHTALLTPDASPELPHHLPASLSRAHAPAKPAIPELPSPLTTTPPPSPLTARHPGAPRRRPSFSLPRPATLIKAGADALKGVNSMGSGGWA